MPVTNASSGIKAGTVAFFAASSAPAGFIKANGAAVSRTTYAALFLAIGTTYGAGDGSTTFNVPDLRGEFVRSFDDGRGVDSGRGIGTAQNGAIQSHRHIVQNLTNMFTLGGGSTNVYYQSGTFNSGGETSYTGDTETRPRNVAMLACIKY